MNIKKRYWDLLELRDKIREPLPVFTVKDSPKDWMKNPTIKIITQKLTENSSILDIGAGDRRLKVILEDVFQKKLNNYFSLDIDEKYKHDYKDICEIKGNFDAIFLMELLEHLYFEEGIALLEKAYSLLKPGGYIFISTPNINHANQLWRSDITHIQQWPSRDLYAILRLIGFQKIEGYRILLIPNRINLKLHIKFFLKKLLCKVLDLDYAHGIFFIAQK
ncbi:MAG TPA: class I SAM-dependent methyltransferase [Candidatus Atribacteria bacterium]|nr:class I SAM-dependent methyltransferase [Candidatus Atribacteria bacterium]